MKLKQYNYADINFGRTADSDADSDDEEEFKELNYVENFAGMSKDVKLCNTEATKQSSLRSRTVNSGIAQENSSIKHAGVCAALSFLLFIILLYVKYKYFN
jgi:deferrochelatase/peroxidase EfeB